MKPEITPRQKSIMEFICQHGSVQVDTLSKYLNVTPQTIRRDLSRLFDLKLITRVHGGAMIRHDIENLGYSARQMLMVEEKTEIAQLAAQLIQDHSSLFINIGTTTEKVANYLTNRTGMMVITNNINVAAILFPVSGVEVMIAGGTVRKSDGGIVGPNTQEFIERFKVDHAVIGCSSIDSDGEIFDFDMQEVRVTQSIIKRARSIIMVADSMKFDRKAPVKVCDLSDIDILVTDRHLSSEMAQLCEQMEVKVEVATAKDVDRHMGESCNVN